MHTIYTSMSTQRIQVWYLRGKGGGEKERVVSENSPQKYIVSFGFDYPQAYPTPPPWIRHCHQITPNSGNILK